MSGKGLCVTCVKDKDCTFTKRYPVVYCEEFNFEQKKHFSAKKACKRKS